MHARGTLICSRRLWLDGGWRRRLPHPTDWRAHRYFQIQRSNKAAPARRTTPARRSNGGAMAARRRTARKSARLSGMQLSGWRRWHVANRCLSILGKRWCGTAHYRGVKQGKEVAHGPLPKGRTLNHDRHWGSGAESGEPKVWQATGPYDPARSVHGWRRFAPMSHHMPKVRSTCNRVAAMSMMRRKTVSAG